MRALFGTLVLVALALAPLSAASVDGLKLHSASAGKGNAALIFVHGWTCDSSSWTAQVPEFAKKYRVLTLDLPGHGQSAVPAQDKFSIGLFARAVEAVRAEAGVDRVVLIGHSMGAPVIREYARLFPQHVAGLVAVDGPLDLRGFGEAREGRGAFTPPPMTGSEGLKAREGMIKGMFTPQTPKPLQDQIMKMMISAPEATAASIRPGTKAEIRMTSSTSQVIAANVTRVSGAMDPATRTMRVEIDLPNTDEAMRPGMYAQVTLTPQPGAGVAAAEAKK